MTDRERFEVGKKIDEGSFGFVHEAFDRLTKRRVAIKFLKDAAELRRFVHEARVLSTQLDNQFVVDLITAHLEGEPPFYIIMEFCELGSLRAWVNQRRPWRECALILAHVMRGLEGLHARGGFHRDLKPENLLLTRNAQGKVLAKLVDFGLARLPLSGTAMTNTAWGTMGYMAPELRHGHPFDSRADIYSLGVVAHELLTGGRTLGALADVAIPDELRDIVNRMLSTAPGARPTTQGIGQAITRALAAVEPAPRRPPPAPPRPSPPTPPRAASGVPWGKLALGLGLLGGAAAAISAISDGGKTWDDDVERYRGPDGRFKSG